MYKCTQCGATKRRLRSEPVYECRRRATGPEQQEGERLGVSDNCSACQCFVFFTQLRGHPEPPVDRSIFNPARPVRMSENGNGHPMPIVPMPRNRQEPESDSAESSDDLSEERERKTSGISLHKAMVVCTLRGTYKISQNMDRRKTMRRLARFCLKINHKLKKTQKELQELKQVEKQQLRALARQDRKKRHNAGTHFELKSPSIWKGKELERIFGVAASCNDKDNPRADALLLSLLKSMQKQVESKDQPRVEAHSKMMQLKRSHYQRIAHDPTKVVRLAKRPNWSTPLKVKGPPLGAQFNTVPVTHKELLSVFTDKSHLLTDTGPKEMITSCNPVHCPVEQCHRVFFPSDLHTHLIYDHQTLNVERVGLRQTKTLYLHPKFAKLNEATSIMLYQVKDKIIGRTKGVRFGNLLPVLLMAARTRYSDVIGLNKQTPEEILLVWLCSFRPTNIRIFGTVSVASSRPNMPDTLSALTAQPYDIRDPRTMAALFQSPSVMFVPHAQLQCMTRCGKDVITVQVHFQ
ncbi:uncharacterized protein LOC117588432 [Drosophila guanche]|uniref:DUF4729 domain-containing protein n=1 Tax=Drosophila guanche TaxID=7266 RepID=A0A3B0K208_DROGU|nr:uncharacterized protein LOC117588432 [Drosophila guanche]SPP86702.1 Hypothetical predicted protein [Drosophila guanche]